jgi:hypothetical protein
MATYNGWSNYPTWNVNLWLDNDEGLPNDVHRMVHRSADVYALSENIKTFVCEDLAPNLSASFASDLLGYALDCVDWCEIAQSWRDDYAEAEDPAEGEE